MPKFSSKKHMLMYIISLLTRPYSVACGSEGACIHVCLCVCVCACVRERERERQIVPFIKKEGGQ